MSDAEDKKPKPSGSVRHDSGGRAVWQWAVESGKHAIDSTSRMLQKLDISHLSILDDEAKPGKKDSEDEVQDPDKPVPTFGGEREVESQASRRQGFDPYNKSKPKTREAAQKPQPPAKPRITQPVRPPAPKKTGFLGKLFGK